MLQVLLVLMTAYSSAAMGQLFFFHVVLIRKVIIMFALETITENIIYVGLVRQSKDLMAKKRDPPGYSLFISTACFQLPPLPSTRNELLGRSLKKRALVLVLGTQKCVSRCKIQGK